MKKILFLASCMYLLLFLSSPVDARLLPRFLRKGTGVVSTGPYVSPRLRKDKLALIVTFGNLQKTRNVTYTLMYQTNGIDQGVSGSLDSSAGNTVTRELLFGTCSSGVCRYHANITQMKLEVQIDLPNGKQITKRYKVRV